LTFDTNEKKLCITFPNGSQIWLSGTDDKERIEKLLGQEWDTTYMNEGSQFPHSTYELLKTRLNPRKGIKPLLIIDYNPPSKKHWGYVIFHLGLNPETKQPLSHPQRYAKLQMNPDDNKENLSDGYIETLESMSEKKRKRFLKGEYSDDTENALWKRAWIEQTRRKEKSVNIVRVVVAIDPNVTEDQKVTDATDEAGVITVAQTEKINGEFHYEVWSDDSTPGLSWGKEAVAAFKRNNADKMVAEVNNGGDLVKMNIRNYDREIAERHYDDVRASRGKEIRADPVADLYSNGFVHHIGEFPELEDELCEWVPGVSRSPNRLDALVWGISYLSAKNSNMKISCDVNI
jgi:phage terminase large subunit-like protein